MITRAIADSASTASSTTIRAREPSVADHLATSTSHPADPWRGFVCVRSRATITPSGTEMHAMATPMIVGNWVLESNARTRAARHSAVPENVIRRWCRIRPIAPREAPTPTARQNARIICSILHPKFPSTHPECPGGRAAWAQPSSSCNGPRSARTQRRAIWNQEG